MSVSKSVLLLSVLFTLPFFYQGCAEDTDISQYTQSSVPNPDPDAKVEFSRDPESKTITEGLEAALITDFTVNGLPGTDSQIAWFKEGDPTPMGQGKILVFIPTATSAGKYYALVTVGTLSFKSTAAIINLHRLAAPIQVNKICGDAGNMNCRRYYLGDGDRVESVETARHLCPILTKDPASLLNETEMNKVSVENSIFNTQINMQVADSSWRIDRWFNDNDCSVCNGLVLKMILCDYTIMGQ